jgi:uncharacterized membrane protein
MLHAVSASVALLAGTAVVLRRKGTPSHRWLGRAYAASMCGTLVTSFLIYDLFGGFGVFHWAAVVSTITLGCGLAAVLFVRPRRGWLQLHLNFMSYSYLGLVAAAVSEATVRLPIVPFIARTFGTSIVLAFGLAVGVPTLAVFAFGSRVIAKRTRASLGPGAHRPGSVVPSASG